MEVIEFVPGRDVFFGVETVWPFYPLAVLSLVIFAAGIRLRWRAWRADSAPDARHLWRRFLLKGFVPMPPGPVSRPAAALLICLAVGFLGLLAGCLLLGIHELVFPFLTGDTYLAYGFNLDICGGLFLVGALGLALRRLMPGRRPGLDGWDAWPILGLLILVGVSGFLAEGARLSATRPDWAASEPIGNWFGGVWRWGGASDLMLVVIWWLHAIASLALIALWPWLKLKANPSQ